MLAPPDKVDARRIFLCLALLWLAGNGLRITILAVPPVIPLIRTDLGMTETQVGILTGHAPMMTLLGSGTLRLGGRTEHRFTVAGGFLQVADDQVRVVTEHATA